MQPQSMMSPPMMGPPPGPPGLPPELMGGGMPPEMMGGGMGGMPIEALLAAMKSGDPQVMAALAQLLQLEKMGGQQGAASPLSMMLQGGGMGGGMPMGGPGMGPMGPAGY